jgi:hypothetical protein
LKTELAALETRTRCTDSGNVGTKVDKVKQRKHDETTPWASFLCQFAATDDHNNCTTSEKSAHLLSVLQGKAADILYNVPTRKTYDDIVGALKASYGDHKLAMAYWYQDKAWA